MTTPFPAQARRLRTSDQLLAVVVVLVILLAALKLVVAPLKPASGATAARRVIHVPCPPNQVEVPGCQPSSNAECKTEVVPEPQLEWPYTDGWH
jgi:hypothetical protein